jgi:hypothetical protein
MAEPAALPATLISLRPTVVQAGLVPPTRVVPVGLVVLVPVAASTKY